MTSRIPFILNIFSSLVKGPIISNGLAASSLHAGKKILFGIALTCFSAPLFSDLYLQLRLFWMQRQLDVLSDFIDRRTLAQRQQKRQLEAILAMKEETRTDMESWIRGREELECLIDFVAHDRELPPSFDITASENAEFDPLSLWAAQDREIYLRLSALKRFRDEIEARVDWIEEASHHLTRATDIEDAEVQLMQRKFGHIR